MLGLNEQPAGVLDAIRGDAPQHVVLVDAFLGRDRVFDHVAATRMQQAVIATGRTSGQVSAVEQQGFETAQGGVTRDAGAGRAAADHQDLGCQAGHGGIIAL